VTETKDIIANNLVENGEDPQIRRELLNWYDTITHQNYFFNNEKILIQLDGLAMGAPSFFFLIKLCLTTYLLLVSHTQRG